MPKTKIICFIGPDGSGKSTLARHLLDEARKNYEHVSYLWWFEGENSTFRKIIRKFRIRRSSGESATKARVTAGNKIIRIFYPRIMLLDYIYFGIKNLTLPKISGKWDVMIFDRFIYDPVVYMSEEFGYNVNKKIKLLKFCSGLLPRPDIIFIIDVPADVSYSRKKHEIYSVRSANKMLLAYKEIYPILGDLAKDHVVKIDNTKRLEDTKNKILNESGLFGQEVECEDDQ
ncbi:hypothetical protein KO465_09225 [Candidatus Micrarchaeota archaeon]|jgi:thymidylate kinase|nr:hypothetical protein [Candidatus Micrarchaeota archaeon]